MSFHLDDLVDLMKSEEKPSSSRNTAKKASVLFFSFGVKAWRDQKIGMNDILGLLTLNSKKIVDKVENNFFDRGQYEQSFYNHLIKMGQIWAKTCQFLLS